MKLERINTNHYNKFQNKLLHIGKFTISVQCNDSVNCYPKQNLKNPYMYDTYEFVLYFKEEPVIPMGYKEYFNKKGIAGNIDKPTIVKMLRYISSPICITMGVECL